VPALPLHCAVAWLAEMAVPSTIAANRVRVALIFEFLQEILMVPGSHCGWQTALSKRLV
jgi:hypothetical protein